MKNLLIILIMVASIGLVKAQTNLIKGKVTQMDRPLSNVEIFVSGSEYKISSDNSGSYEISTNPGNVIHFFYPGLIPVEIIVEDVTRVLNVQMFQKIEELDEVIVKGSNRKSQNELQEEYGYNPNLLKTAFGIIDSETSPGNIRFLKDEEINDVGICILDVVRNEFPGVRVFGDCMRGGGIFIRGLNSVNQAPPAVYDVDGQILTNTPTWILPASISRLAVLNNMAMTTRYGSIGAGGVIVINTKSGSSAKLVNGKPFDFARLRNNMYDNSALSSLDVEEDRPSYLTDLLNSSTEIVAMNTYQEQIKRYGSSYYYVLDAYNYFSNRWKNAEYATMIINENQGILKNNPLALKSLAYIYQAEGQFEKANNIYKEIFILRANYAQSYLDLANSYRELGEYQKATAIYARFDYLQHQDYLKRNEDLQMIMDRELNNLMVLRGEDLLFKSELKNITYDDEFYGTRLVFEWNDSEAEFELQFVNPEGRYFKSEHSLFADADRIKNEKISGFSTEEYLIDESIRGIWQVNARYLGNKSLTPTYLKATVYHNYGSASQRKETKVFKLSLKTVNQQLFTVSNAVGVVAN